MAFGTQSDDQSGVPISSVYNKEANTFNALQGEPGAYVDANSNQSSAAVMSFLRPLIVQKTHNVTGSGAKTLACAFTNNNIAGNSIIVAMGMGEVDNGSTITLAITDTNNNTYISAVKASQSTTLEAAIFYAVNISAGANTITITIAGGSSSNTAIAVEIYEVWGLINLVETLDQTSTGNNAGSTSPATSAISPAIPNELFIAAISTAGGTITAGINWTLDSTSLSPTGGNLISFGVESRLHTTIASLTPSATLSSSNVWAMTSACFKSIIIPIEGTVKVSNAATLGQQTMANSLPIVPASDYLRLPSDEQYAALGQSFMISTAAFTGATGGSGKFGAISVFNPSGSGRNIKISKIIYFDNFTLSGFDYIHTTTSDPAYGTATYVNNFLVAAGQSPIFTATMTTDTGTLLGNTWSIVKRLINTDMFDALQNQAPILIQPGNGIAMYIDISASGSHFWGCNIIVTQL